MEVYGKNLVAKFVYEEEVVTESGIVIKNFLFSSAGYIKSEVVKVKIIGVGDECHSFFREGDVMLISKHDGTITRTARDEFLFLKEEQPLVRVNEDGSYDIVPDRVVVRMLKNDREALFKKKIKREDGTLVDLFITIDASPDEDRFHELFVSNGEVYQVGEGVENVLPGDIAILDYNVDTNGACIIGYENEDKLVCIPATTTYHAEDFIVNANRRSGRDQMVWARGDYNQLSPLIGIIRAEELISRDPFVFLDHESNIVHKVSAAGLIYQETYKVVSREVLSVSAKSKKKYGIEKGEKVIVRDCDTFHITLRDKKVTCVNDVDVIGNASLIKPGKDRRPEFSLI